jgi:glycosyltransferase involved in cell wall biosynthesis
MRIVHVLDGIGVGGAEFVLLNLVRGLQAEGHHNTVISLTTPSHMRTELKAAGAAVLSLDMSRGRLALSDAIRVRDAIRRASPDLIQGWMYHGNAAAALGRLLAVHACPLVWSIHNTLEPAPDYRLLTRLAMRGGALFSGLCGAIVYVSAASARQHEQRGYRADRTAVISNGIDVGRFRPDERARHLVRVALGLDASTPLVGCFARWDPMKGHDRLLRALACQSASKRMPPHLVLAGSGIDKDNAALLAMIEEAGLRGRVSLLGARSDVPQLMNALDLFVLPSIWGEAFPLVLGEAMATGVPSIATDIGDCGLLLGDHGLLVPPGDDPALASAIDAVFSLGPAERVELGARARARVIEQFSLSSMIERYASLYGRLVRQPQGTPQWAA